MPIAQVDVKVAEINYYFTGDRQTSGNGKLFCFKLTVKNHGVSLEIWHDIQKKTRSKFSEIENYYHFNQRKLKNIFPRVRRIILFFRTIALLFSDTGHRGKKN